MIKGRFGYLHIDSSPIWNTEAIIQNYRIFQDFTNSIFSEQVAYTFFAKLSKLLITWCWGGFFKNVGILFGVCLTCEELVGFYLEVLWLCEEIVVGLLTKDGGGLVLRGFPFTCSSWSVFVRKKIFKNQFTFFKKNMITCLFETINYKH